MTARAIQSVADTAFMVAAWRALESARPDALFQDPLAAKLAGAEGRDIVAGLPQRFPAGWTIAIRTVIIDGFIRSCLDAGVDTVLNLGAGLDARPYRLALPESLRWIEVDYPSMIDVKEERLAGEQPRCAVERVKMDLLDVTARRQLFADVATKSQKLLVITEGVIPYWSPDEVSQLADDLRQIRAMFWIVDYFSREAIRFRQRVAYARHLRNAPFRLELDDWFGFFEGRGWRAKEVRYIVDESERLNRGIPLPRFVKVLYALRGMFLSPKRREALRHFAGYVLLEPT